MHPYSSSINSAYRYTNYIRHIFFKGNNYLYYYIYYRQIQVFFYLYLLIQ